MSNIANIPQNTLKIETAKQPLVYIPTIHQIVVRHEMGKVILFISRKRVELDTLTAHRIGYAMGIAKLAPDEMIVLTINGEKIDLLWPIAVKVSAALLRKADDADDWQLRRMK